MKRAVVLFPLLVLGTMVAFVSCAEKSEVDSSSLDSSSAIPPSDAAELDASSDVDAAPSVPPCESVEWCTVSTPLPLKYAFTSIWGTSANDVWAVGSGGTIVHYDGTAWTAMPSEYPETFFDVWASGPNDVWVVASSELLLHSSGIADGGAGWTNFALTTNANASIPPSRRVYAVWGSTPDDVRVGADSSPAHVVSPDSQIFQYAGNVTQFLKSTTDDGDVRWRVMPSRGQSVRSIWGSSGTDVWMAVEDVDGVSYDGGAILHGTPYTGKRPNPEALKDTCFECNPGCTACAVVDDPLLWTPVEAQSQVAMESIWGSSANDVWAVGRRGTVRHFGSGDERWQIVESPTTETLHRVWGSGPNDVWMVGDDGVILHFDGTSLKSSTAQIPAEHRPNLRGVWGSGPNDVWIVGDGIALHYTGPKVAP